MEPRLAIRSWPRPRARVARLLPALSISLALSISAALGGLARSADLSPPITLQQEIDALLQRKAARRAFWGIQIRALDEGTVLYEHNAHKVFVPASNQKLFSTALGLTRLGPNHRYSTSVVAEGEIDGEGTLRGNLVLRGGGDPNLSARVLPYDHDMEFEDDLMLPVTELARQAIAGGLRRVEGSIIGDDTRYVWQKHGAGWSVDDPTWGYGAPISALSFNDNHITMRVLPGRAAGRPARVRFKPRIPFFEIANRTRTSSRRYVTRALKIDRQPGSRRIDIWGDISIRSGGRQVAMAVDDPALYAATVLASELARLGVKISGSPEARHAWPHAVRDLKSNRSAPPKPTGQVLSVIQSVPLGESLKVINKVSQNLHAEMLLREVSFMRRGVGSFEGGLEELEGFLLEAGLKPGEFICKDASGLSRHNLVSPAATVELLKYMWASPHRDLYRSTLAVAGSDGTLDWRFSRTPARGRIRAKTGTLSNVSALSGYARSADGADLVFSIFVNNAAVPASYIRRLVDQIAVAMVKPRRRNPARRRGSTAGTASAP